MMTAINSKMHPQLEFQLFELPTVMIDLTFIHPLMSAASVLTHPFFIHATPPHLFLIASAP